MVVEVCLLEMMMTLLVSREPTSVVVVADLEMGEEHNLVMDKFFQYLRTQNGVRLLQSLVTCNLSRLTGCTMSGTPSTVVPGAGSGPGGGEHLGILG